MFKKIRDFIYDINDIFVALIIIALAAGVIYWKANDIIAYPKYVAEKQPTESIDIDFSDVNLDPEEVEVGVNTNPEDEGALGGDGELEPGTPGEEGEGGEETPGEEGKENTDDKKEDDKKEEDKKEDDKKEEENKEEGEQVQVVIPMRTTWTDVAKNLSDLGLIEDSDEARRQFWQDAINLKLDRQLFPGTYTVRKGMTNEQILKILCRQN